MMCCSDAARSIGISGRSKIDILRTKVIARRSRRYRSPVAAVEQNCHESVHVQTVAKREQGVVRHLRAQLASNGEAKQCIVRSLVAQLAHSTEGGRYAAGHP